MKKLKLAECYDANHSSHDWPMMNNTECCTNDSTRTCGWFCGCKQSIQCGLMVTSKLVSSKNGGDLSVPSVFAIHPPPLSWGGHRPLKSACVISVLLGCVFFCGFHLYPGRVLARGIATSGIRSCIRGGTRASMPSRRRPSAPDSCRPIQLYTIYCIQYNCYGKWVE